MTRDQANKILAQRGGTTDLKGFLELYEAFLITWGWEDAESREREIDRVRAVHEGTS
jgi:hypothetical protein